MPSNTPPSRIHEKADLAWIVLQLRSIAGFHFPEQPDGAIILEAALRLEEGRYADLEHEHLGCHVARTGIYFGGKK